MAENGEGEQTGGFPLIIGNADDGAEFNQQAADGDGEGEAPSVEDQIAQLQERIATGENRWAAEREFFQSTMRDLAAGKHGDTNTSKAPELTMDDLPDPVEKPKEFKAALAKRVAEFSTAQLQHTQQTQQQQFEAQSTQQQKLAALNERFTEKFPDLAKKGALLQGATAFEASELKRAGINDVQAHILRDPDAFLDKVAARMNAELGITGAPNKTNTQPRPANRTQGVSSGTRAKTGGAQPQQPVGFMEQLSASRRESGIV